MKTMEVNGIRSWEEAGDGQPVIFFHGISPCPRLWRHVIPKVSSARCLVWEMVGYGASIPEGKAPGLLTISMRNTAPPAYGV